MIDNWSEFGGPKFDFEQNVKRFLSENKGMQVINEDAYSIRTLQQLAHAPYDIYMFDGNHTVESHEKAFTTYWPYLADTCIIMVDDWNWPSVKQGTLQGLLKVKANVVHMVDIAAPE